MNIGPTMYAKNAHGHVPWLWMRIERENHSSGIPDAATHLMDRWLHRHSRAGKRRTFCRCDMIRSQLRRLDT